MDKKIILWSLVLFFGCSIVFRAIDDAASSGGKGLSLGIQAVVMVAIIGVVVLIFRRKN